MGLGEEYAERMRAPLNLTEDDERKIAKLLGRCEQCGSQPDDCECTAPPDAQSASR